MFLKKPLQLIMIESTRRHVTLEGNSKFYEKESWQFIKSISIQMIYS
jgi:hypothetical protein